jgi:hypothetical protein
MDFTKPMRNRPGPLDDPFVYYIILASLTKLASSFSIMPPPSRAQRSSLNRFNESDIIPYVRKAGPCFCSTPGPMTNSTTAAHIETCYSAYSNELCPLASFKVIPDSLFAVPLSNGDIILRPLDGPEATFDIIGVVVSSCLEPPPGFSKLVSSDFRYFTCN